MFKQPAGNTNATPIDEQRSAERAAKHDDNAKEHAEIEAEAKRLAAARGSECAAEDWERAARIVRNRKISLSKA